LLGGEDGFAIAFSLLMILILTLLGASLILIAATENRIAENEKLSAQTLYAAESAVHVVKRWFDRPESSANVVNPTPTIVNRSLRLIDADGDPGTAPVAADGTTGSPYYKQGFDRGQGFPGRSLGQGLRRISGSNAQRTDHADRHLRATLCAHRGDVGALRYGHDQGHRADLSSQ
jgi:hypothetical protein